jgi:hypothetical protein
MPLHSSKGKNTSLSLSYVRPRYSLGGDRPSQTTRQVLSHRNDGCVLSISYKNKLKRYIFT